MNPVQLWAESDPFVQQTIERLTLSGMSLEQQAQEAFEIICKKYGLPQYPESFTEEDYEKYEEQGIANPRSVFEEAAMIRFLDPAGDPRGIILCALYNVKHKKGIDIIECAAMHFGGKRKIPKEFMIYFKGDGIKGELHFPEKGRNWVDMGGRCASKIIR